jgi:hypothetical protein
LDDADGLGAHGLFLLTAVCILVSLAFIQWLLVVGASRLVGKSKTCPQKAKLQLQVY